MCYFSRLDGPALDLLAQAAVCHEYAAGQIVLPPLARQVVEDLAGRVMHLVRMVEDPPLRSLEARLARPQVW